MSRQSAQETVLAILRREGARGPEERRGVYERLAERLGERMRRAGLDDSDPRFAERLEAFAAVTARIEQALAADAPPAAAVAREAGSEFVAARRARAAAPAIALALLLAGGLVALAIASLSPVLPGEDGTPAYWMIAGDAFTAPAGTTVASHEEGSLIASTAARPQSGGTTGGAYLTLSSNVEERLSGRRVRVVVSARRAPQDGSPEMAVAYSTAAVGNSGWHRFALSDTLEQHAFAWHVPERRGAPGRDFIGVWADTAGKGRAVIVSDVRVFFEEGR